MSLCHVLRGVPSHSLHSQPVAGGPTSSCKPLDMHSLSFDANLQMLGLGHILLPSFWGTLLSCLKHTPVGDLGVLVKKSVSRTLCICAKGLLL